MSVLGSQLASSSTRQQVRRFRIAVRSATNLRDLSTTVFTDRFVGSFCRSANASKRPLEVTAVHESPGCTCKHGQKKGGALRPMPGAELLSD